MMLSSSPISDLVSVPFRHTAMYAFSASPLSLIYRTPSLNCTSSRILDIRTTRFRGSRLQSRLISYCNHLSCHQIQTPKCFSDPPADDEDNEDEEEVEITLMDPRTNRTLAAGVEHTIAHKDKSYVLCYPMDDPVTFARTSDSGLLHPVDDDVLVQKMFPNAEAVLSEEHIALKNSAFFMTVDDQSEDLGDEDEDDDDDEGHQDEGDDQDVEIIAEFLYDEVQHFVVRPMDAILLVAEVLENGYRVLEGNELEKVSPVIEEFIENQST